MWSIYFVSSIWTPLLLIFFPLFLLVFCLLLSWFMNPFLILDQYYSSPFFSFESLKDSKSLKEFFERKDEHFFQWFIQCLLNVYCMIDISVYGCCLPRFIFVFFCVCVSFFTYSLPSILIYFDCQFTFIKFLPLAHIGDPFSYK